MSTNLNQPTATELRDVRLIATDMDHTLLTEDSQLPPHFGDYLDRLAAVGVQVAIASGRPLYTLHTMFAQHQAQLAFISDNGGVIAARDEIISKNPLPTAAYQDMVRFMQTETAGFPLLCGLAGALGEQGTEQYDAVFREFYTNLDYVAGLANYVGPIVKVTIYLPAGDAQRVFDEQLQPRYGQDFSVAVSGDVWIDIMPKQVDKGLGMRLLGQKMGIGPEQMMAFGDNFNDAEMLATVKYSYLMANAKPAMRQFATYQTSSNEEYGVLQILDQVLAAHQ